MIKMQAVIEDKTPVTACSIKLNRQEKSSCIIFFHIYRLPAQLKKLSFY